jgi:hypothetical protein
MGRTAAKKTAAKPRATPRSAAAAPPAAAPPNARRGENIDSDLMRLTLELGVPVRALELMHHGGPSRFDFDEARAFADVLAEKGDILQFRGGKKGEAGEIMGGLIRAVAVMAFVPGGVTVFGAHFQYDAR